MRTRQQKSDSRKNCAAISPIAELLSLQRLFAFIGPMQNVIATVKIPGQVSDVVVKKTGEFCLVSYCRTLPKCDLRFIGDVKVG